MAKLFRAFLILALFTSLSMFAQSADQQIVSAIDSPDPVVPGNNITYTIQMANNGPDPATNGGLNVNLSPSLVLQTTIAPAGFTCSVFGSNISCTNPSWAVGSATFTLVAQVPASLLNFPDGTVTSTFFTSGTTPDPNSGNNLASVTTNYDSPQIDLMLSVSDSPDPVFPDGNITYTIPIANAGPDAATNVNFNVFNNGSLKFQSATAPAGWSCTLPAVNGTPTFTCTNPSFAGGANGNFIVVVKADSTVLGANDGTVSTAFSINGTGNEFTNANNNETENTAYVTPDADMAITVSDSPDPVFPDGDITYTVQVTNNGPDTATNATMSVFNNNTLRFQSATVPAGWNCSLPAVDAAPVFTCTNPSFANGASSTFTVVVRAYDEVLGINDGTVQTAFTAGSALSDPNNANNSETETTAYVTPDSDMAISVTDSPDPVSPDGDITYTVQVTNNGPDAATNASMSVFNNNSLRFQSVTTPAGWSCSAPAVDAAPVFTCTNPSFANGASSTFTVVLRAYKSVIGINDTTLQTTFTAGSANADPNNANNSETETTAYVTPDADISVTNSDSPDPVVSGATITYTQSISNGGPDAAPNATFSQVLQASVGFQSITTPAGWSCTTPAVGASGLVNCTNPSFASGATANFTLVVNVIATSGTVTSTVTGGSSVQDPDNADTSATVTTTILSPVTAELAITKSTTADGAAAGSSYPYTITLTNNGPDAAANVVVTDILPAQLLFQSISVPAGFNCTTPAVGANGTITCTRATMASGTTSIFTLIVKVAGNAVGTINNNATASSDTLDSNTGNNSGSAAGVPVAAGNSADLAVQKSTPTTTAAAGSSITYTITVTNNGPGAANDVIVTDALPASLRFQSIAPAATFNCTTPAVGTNGSITCIGGPLASGAVATFTLVTTVAPGATGSVTNSASASTSDTDPVAGNSSGTSGAVILGNADLSVTKTTPATQAQTGSTITYTITVTNNGPDAATNVVVADDLPAGLQFVSATPSQGTCNAADPVSCSIGTLANGASATVTLQAMVTATSGTITNSATATSDVGDGNPGNNGGSSPAAPVVPGAPGAPHGIPTLSEWALIALVAMLGGIAVMKMKA
jgi:uncharacterized repeat protein (TIGR01451 family)